MKRINILMFIFCIVCAFWVYLAALQSQELPRRVKLISRSEKVIRVYDASVTVKDGELLIHDAVLISETDVSRYVE